MAQILCPECGTEFSELKFTKHFRRYHYENPVECATCGKTLKNLNCLADHKKIHDMKKKCEECGKSCAPKAMARHMKVHLSLPLMIHQCGICTNIFSRAETLKNHEKRCL